MTTTKWVIVDKKWCEYIEMEATIMEQRLYPPDLLPDSPSYRVISRKCSANIVCNLTGVPCAYAFTNPTTNRFELG
ncbi:MAG: hypothetical protein M5U34_20560 [Chloroflexi bacterium]|nr:hypothetical protein [Chloroflexota bacterium]